MNKIINERAKSMSLHSGLPKAFWANIINIAVYLINHGPSVLLEYKLPKEVWSRKEERLTHLKAFGCASYVYVESNYRRKLDAKAMRYFFISNGDG